MTWHLLVSSAKSCQTVVAILAFLVRPIMDRHRLWQSSGTAKLKPQG